jgi:hypothetical protein
MKYSQPPFSRIPGTDISRHAMGLLTRITAVTGWKLPDGDTLKALVNEFSAYLIESCGAYNPNEIAYAVRTYGGDVTEWGKNLNILLIDECMGKYKNERSAISTIEEVAIAGAADGQKSIENTGLVDWIAEWGKLVEGAKNGTIHNVFISTAIYDWLEREEKIDFHEYTAKVKWEILKECKNRYLEDMQTALLNPTGGQAPSYVIKDRLIKLNDIDAYNVGGQLMSKAAWRSDPEIMSALAIMSKQEIVRQLAILEAANQLL